MTAGPTAASAHAAPLTPQSRHHPPVQRPPSAARPETRMRRLSFAAAVIRSPVSPPLASPYPTQATPTGTSREAASCHVCPSNADPQSSGRARRHAAQGDGDGAECGAHTDQSPHRARSRGSGVRPAPLPGSRRSPNPVSNVRYGPYSVCAPRTAPMPTVPITGPSTSSDTWPSRCSRPRYSRARRGPRYAVPHGELEKRGPDVRAEAQPGPTPRQRRQRPGRPAHGERDDRIRRRMPRSRAGSSHHDEPHGIHDARLTEQHLREQREAQCVPGRGGRMQRRRRPRRAHHRRRL